MDKLVIIGLDGVPFRVMDELSETGVMPNFKKLKNNYFTKMTSSIPEISSVSWASIVTGKNPGEHDIFGFTEMIRNSYSLRFPNFSSVKEPPFWEKFDNKTSVIINVPMTFPVKPMNGAIISGFISLDMKKAVYPERLITYLDGIDYKIDVDSNKAHSSILLFLKDLFDILDRRKLLADKLWKFYDWDIFMYVITGTDRIGHFLFSAYENEEHPDRRAFMNFFKRVDKQIGDIVEKMDDSDSLIMLSDHGMETTNFNVYLNKYLENEGFLELADGKPGFGNLTKNTKAFALDPSRIYLNREKEYPNGSVTVKEKPLIIEQLAASFNKLKIGGKKVIKKIYERNEIYHGKYLYNAPDLVLLPNPGFSLKARFEDGVFGKPEKPFEGHHTQADAFLLVKTNKDIALPKYPDVTNVFNIIKDLIGGNDE